MSRAIPAYHLPVAQAKAQMARLAKDPRQQTPRASLSKRGHFLWFKMALRRLRQNQNQAGGGAPAADSHFCLSLFRQRFSDADSRQQAAGAAHSPKDAILRALLESRHLFIPPSVSWGRGGRVEGKVPFAMARRLLMFSRNHGESKAGRRIVCGCLSPKVPVTYNSVRCSFAFPVSRYPG